MIKLGKVLLKCGSVKSYQVLVMIYFSLFLFFGGTVWRFPKIGVPLFIIHLSI